ncbi:MAG TPA: preprotein translocase subunit SecG [Elusimicrobiota bacterium]|nr:preprotein translocase subunit SecG [Elusimicrobiota bacterium]
MFYHFILSVHVFVCALLVLVILLQTGRGAGLSVFGGGGDSLITTPTGSNFLKTATQVLAGVFAATSLFLTLLTNRTGMSSVTSRFSLPQAPVSQPAAPSTPAASQPKAGAPVKK